MRFLLLPLVLLATLAPVPASAQSPRGQTSEGLPGFSAADPQAPPVTAGNVLEQERFWPYRVSLAEDWTPPGGPPLEAGLMGVLLRLEPGGKARVDFGRDGLQEVPVAATDLVERANGVREGTLDKIAPNLLHAVGPRLADPAAPAPSPYPMAAAAGHRAFLSVYADPLAEGFDDLVASLEPLRQREGLLTMFFPQGRIPDLDVRRQLREMGWTVPFVLDHLAEPYTRVQLGEEVALPAVQLQTAEGRVLFRSAWQPGAMAGLAAALDRALSAPVARTSERSPAE